MLWTAFTIGLFGSVHCVGMCGPLALALPTGGRGPLALLPRVLLYNLGRISTYVVLGAMVGSLGLGSYLAGWQSTISIALGIFLLIVAIWQIDVERYLLRAPLIARLSLSLRNTLSRYLGNSGNVHYFRVGLLNGMLPCGLVYLAILGAVTTTTPLEGSLYMVTFGLGTVPLMAITVVLGQLSALPLRRTIQRLYPLLLVGLGCWFVLRGMQFELPANFNWWEAKEFAPMCQ